jgi:hypothetical protein
MPPPNAKRRPGGGGAAVLTGNEIASEDSRSAATAQLRRCARFRRLTERLHRLGPRPVGELLLEVANGRDLIEALEEYARLDPALVRRLDARDWPPVVWRAA